MRTPLIKLSILLTSFLLTPESYSKEPIVDLPVVDLNEKTILQIQKDYDTHKYTSKQVVEWYLKKIKTLNKQGVNLRAVLSINPNALKIAEALDKERALTGPRSAMHGIPILLKDNIETKDPIATTAGSLALKDNFAKNDAKMVASLRMAGAIILGKANLSEWANFRSFHSSSGWSAVGGQVKNPYLLSASPCGSSAGSAASVAVNMVSVAIGTETDGSILCPAAYNGIVGLKPTVGLVSVAGIIPLAPTQDTSGPMGRTVSDVAILLNAMATNEDHKKNYVDALKKDALKGKRIGILRGEFDGHPLLEGIFESSLKVLKKQGAILVDNLTFQKDDMMDSHEMEVFFFEFKHYMNEYLKQTPAEVKSKTLADLIEFNRTHKSDEMPYFNQELFLISEEKTSLKDKKYKQALMNSHIVMKQRIDRFMAEHHLDMIIFPTANPAPSIDLINGEHHTGGSYVKAAVSGYPSLTVPMGFIHDLPVGLTFMTKAYGEEIIIGAAYGFEQNSNHRRAPKLKKRPF